MTNSVAHAQAPVANLHETRKALAQSEAQSPRWRSGGEAGSSGQEGDRQAGAVDGREACQAGEGPLPRKHRPSPPPSRHLQRATHPPKLRWVFDSDKDEKGRHAAHTVTDDGAYAITGKGDSWRATWTTDGGKVEVLAEKASHTKAYYACVTHHKGVVK